MGLKIRGIDLMIVSFLLIILWNLDKDILTAIGSIVLGIGGLIIMFFESVLNERTI